ncbi:SDR family NAD(P)-dependent oxidoreductase [Paraconexibacter sp.]|uniref:SDR family NAD(P)-dependent oxidoreductase n=1 Tax=Paraconexibacter sp. TaxID=2949640 RepID=UPI003566F910
MAELEGKRALITGAATGLGRAIAELFVERGATVFLTDINEEGVAATADELGAAGSCKCDVASSADQEAQFAAAVEAMGGLDLVVNNAGIEIASILVEQSEEDFDRMMDINVKGVWLGMKHATPHLVAGGGGTIVNMSSVAGVGGAPLLGSYCASKAAVIQLTRVAAVELRAHNIRVNAVCPAFIDTAMVDRLVAPVEALTGLPFEDLTALKQGRRGTPAEVAEMTAFLASDDASWTTGSHYVLDNALTAGLL